MAKKDRHKKTKNLIEEKQSKMKKIIPIITIFAIDLFFSISSLIGYTYLGKESSPIYIIYNLIIFILSIIATVNGELELDPLTITVSFAVLTFAWSIFFD